MRWPRPAKATRGESAAERTLLAKVEEIIQRLVAEFNENLTIFMTLEEEFRDFLDQHRRRVEITERRAAEIQRGQERLELARNRAEFELAARSEGRQLPQAVAEFLGNPWQHHITPALLREGEVGDGFTESLELADGILEEVAEAQRHIVGKLWLQNWQPGLRKVFASVGLHGDAAEAAIGALHDTLQAVADARPEMERPLPELPAVALPQPAPVERNAIEIVAGTDTPVSTMPTPSASARCRSAPGWISSTRMVACSRASCRGSAPFPRGCCSSTAAACASASPRPRSLR